MDQLIIVNGRRYVVEYVKPSFNEVELISVTALNDHFKHVSIDPEQFREECGDDYEAIINRLESL